MMTADSPFRYCPHCRRRLVPIEVAGQLRPACPLGHYIHFRDPKVAVGVVARRHDAILLQQRRVGSGKGKWGIPGGFVDAGEPPEEAAVREVREEALVEVRLDGLLGVHGEEGNPVIFIVYYGVIVAGEPKPGPESMDVGLFHPTELPPLAFSRDERIIEAWSAAVGR